MEIEGRLARLEAENKAQFHDLDQVRADAAQTKEAVISTLHIVTGLRSEVSDMLDAKMATLDPLLAIVPVAKWLVGLISAALGAIAFDLVKAWVGL